MNIPIGEEKVFVTFSVGIKQVSDEDVNVEKLVNNANKAMQDARKSGGNRIVRYENGINIAGEG